MTKLDVRVPNIGESITEVTLSQWLKADGQYVQMDEPICEFESDKATLELPAESAGKLIHVANEGDDLEIGAIIARIDTSVKAPETEKSDSEKLREPSESASENNYTQGLPSPAARKLMTEHELKKEDISASGKSGRITKADVLETLNKLQRDKETDQKISPPVIKQAKTSESEKILSKQPPRGTRREKMSRIRRTIAARLVSAKNNTAMLTTFNEIDMSAIMEIRKKFQEDFVARYDIKLGFMSFFAKACAQILQEMPNVNAYLDGNELIYHDYVDISIAISTPNGLVVPPVHNVESLTFHEIEARIKDLAGKAREGKLSLEEMQGGTFTITNGGIFGSLLSTPILNEPQSAILGMHAIQDRPVVINGEIRVRPMMYVALSYDHRVIDGSSSVTFLVKVKQLLEDPMKMILGL